MSHYVDYIPLNITSDVTSVGGKNITLKVGSQLDIYETLTFANGKTKLNGNGVHAHKLKVEIVKGEGIVINDDMELVAQQANKSVDFKVSLSNNPNISTTFTVKTAAMDAVKNLKVSNIMDNQCDITFTHPAVY